MLQPFLLAALLQAPSPAPTPKPQPRPPGVRVAVDPTRIEVDDGDSITIRWSASDVETVRFLGIDTPETRHLEHEIPFDQSFGPEARAFAEGVFATATRMELLRAPILDPFGRSLAYVFLGDRNYSVLVVTAGLAEESIGRYGDNGFPAEAALVLAAAKVAGPPRFESPGAYRARMRVLSRWLKEHGRYPGQ